MTIIVDTREKEKIIEGIISYFDHEKINHYKSKLIVADYMSIDNPRVYIDRKHNLGEVATNLTSDSGRFMDEIRLAQKLGIHIVVLIEQGGQIRNIEDVANWNNPMKGKLRYAISGRNLMEKIYNVHISYGVDFLFCDKRSTGRRIVEILEGSNNVCKQ